MNKINFSTFKKEQIFLFCSLIISLLAASSAVLAETASETGELGERLLQAVDADNLELVGLCIDGGVDVNYKDEYGLSAIVSACMADFTDIVELLLAQPGIDIGASYNDGLKGLIAASNNGSEEIVAMLLNYNFEHDSEIDVNASDRHGNTALILAAAFNHTGVAQMLLTHPEIEVDAANKQNSTALLYACVNGNLDLTRVLLETGKCNVNDQKLRNETGSFIPEIRDLLDEYQEQISAG